MPKFNSTPAKDQIRYSFDREIVREFREALCPGTQLSYLGLPGEKLLDILSWREYLGRCTAVENTELADAIEIEVLHSRLEGKIRIIRGNIDALINDEANTRGLEWPYQVVNLDYCGGLVHLRQNHTSERLKALGGLFHRQAGSPFVLFLTINLRDRDGGELATFVDEQEEDLAALGLSNVRQSFADHRALRHAGLLKIYVPIFLNGIVHRHRITTYDPILYKGTKRMLHFAFRCDVYEGLGSGRMPLIQERIAILNRPMRLLEENGELRTLDFAEIG